MVVRLLVISVFVVGVSVMSPAAQAQLIVYDGFGYPDDEYFQISDGGAGSSGIYDNLDDGVGLIYDHDNDPDTPDQASSAIVSVNGDFTANNGLGAPGRNGGVGPWVTSWTKRGRTDARAAIIDGTSTLSYTDSNGNSLATTLGKPDFNGVDEHGHAWRTFDASGIAGGSLTFANTAGDYNVPRLGRQDSVVWMSFLADRSIDEGANPSSSNWFVSMQFWNKQGASPLGDPFVNRTGGIFRDDTAGDWLIWDAANGGDPTGPSGLGDIPGSGAADDDESNGDVFIVVKLDYSATIDDQFEGLITDGYADVSVWVDPNLDDVEPTGSPDVTGSAYYAFNGINFFSSARPDFESTSSLDEIRLGVTYADVSPIASPEQDGDFDDDGDVDGADFLAWQRGEAAGGATPANLTLWEDNYGANALSTVSSVPEPASVLLLGIAGVMSVMRRRR